MGNKISKQSIFIGLALFFAVTAVAALWFSSEDQQRPDRFFGLWRLRDIALTAGLLFASSAMAVAAIGRSASVAFWATCLPTLLFVFALEALGRVGVIDWTTLLSPRTAQADGPGWTLQPNATASGETYQDIATRLGVPHAPMSFEFQTDRHGFRNEPGAEADIIFLGDSIVLGAQVSKSNTVDQVTASALSQPVMQAALLGLSIQEQHDMLRASDLDLRGKHVVQFFFEGNDLLDSRRVRETPVVTNPDTVSSGSSLINFVWPALVRLSNPPAEYARCDIEDQAYYFLWTRLSFDGVLDEFEAIANALRDFEQEMAAAGAQYSLVFAPTKYRVLHQNCAFPEKSLLSNPSSQLSDLPNRVSDWATQNDVPFLDLTSVLKEAASQGQTPWFWGDTHWAPDGHAAAGIAIATWLQPRLTLHE